jgi:hypothetical protein
VFRGIAGLLSSSGKFSGVLDRIEVQGLTDTPRFTVASSSHQVQLNAVPGGRERREWRYVSAESSCNFLENHGVLGGQRGGKSGAIRQNRLGHTSRQGWANPGHSAALRPVGASALKDRLRLLTVQGCPRPSGPEPGISTAPARSVLLANHPGPFSYQSKQRGQNKSRECWRVWVAFVWASLDR